MNTKLGVLIAVAVIVVIVAPAATTSFQKAGAFLIDFIDSRSTRNNAPIATSGDNNIYVTWWSNKTGNDEVMFKASTDGGKTWSNKINLSNTPNSNSQDAEIAAAGNNVYVTWWERNQTMNEPVMRVSNDNGKTFGEKIMLSEK
jgi:hypothetical protein